MICYVTNISYLISPGAGHGVHIVRNQSIENVLHDSATDNLFMLRVECKRKQTYMGSPSEHEEIFK